MAAVCSANGTSAISKSLQLVLRGMVQQLSRTMPPQQNLQHLQHNSIQNNPAGQCCGQRVLTLGHFGPAAFLLTNTLEPQHAAGSIAAVTPLCGFLLTWSSSSSRAVLFLRASARLPLPDTERRLCRHQTTPSSGVLWRSRGLCAVADSILKVARGLHAFHSVAGACW